MTILRVIGSLSLACLVSSCSGMPITSDPVVVKRAQTHMGTLVTITAVAPTESGALAASTAAFSEIHRLEELLSTWIPTSELSRVNAAAGQKPVPVGSETIELVRRSIEIAAMTDGGFNIAIGPAVDAWNVLDGQRIPTQKQLERLTTLVDMQDIQLNEREGTLALAKRGMKIDIGGIGKGYAADRAVEVMQSAGATAGVVALSGDIKSFGRLPHGAKFPVGIQHPRREGAVLTVIELENEAISTAGDYERFFERDGVRYHHILDPRTLLPARDCQSVTIIAKDGIWADGLDTGIFVMGPERGMELVEHLEGVEAIIVDAEGRVHLSSGLRSRVRLSPELDVNGSAR
jgi:FAD:protein FMN transferase